MVEAACNKLLITNLIFDHLFIPFHSNNLSSVGKLDKRVFNLIFHIFLKNEEPSFKYFQTPSGKSKQENFPPFFQHPLIKVNEPLHLL